MKTKATTPVSLSQMLASVLKGALRPLNLEVRRRVEGYSEAGLSTVHNHDFLRDPRYVAAYNRGVQAAEEDYQWHWRVHVGLWAATHGAKLEGDFVECGVNRGALSSAIMQYLNWNQLNRNFFLFDTFRGLDDRYLLEEERTSRQHLHYTECYAQAQANFAEYRNVHLIRGTVPETLTNVRVEKVCYLALDMNCARPEVEAASYFWEKLSRGAVVLLDDYAFKGHESEKRELDKFAESKGVEALSLPTGQGIILKP